MHTHTHTEAHTASCTTLHPMVTILLWNQAVELLFFPLQLKHITSLIFLEKRKVLDVSYILTVSGLRGGTTAYS